MEIINTLTGYFWLFMIELIHSTNYFSIKAIAIVSLEKKKKMSMRTLESSAFTRTPLIEPINHGLSTLSFALRFALRADSARVISRLLDNSICDKFKWKGKENEANDRHCRTRFHVVRIVSKLPSKIYLQYF